MNVAQTCLLLGLLAAINSRAALYLLMAYVIWLCVKPR